MRNILVITALTGLALVIYTQYQKVQREKKAKIKK